MAKFKKSIITIVLALMVVLSSMLLMACNKKITNTDTFNIFETTLTTYKNNTKLFGTGAVSGVQSNFKLKNFFSLNEDGNIINDDENYVTLVALGLNYIEDNYAKLEELDEKQDYEVIYEKVDEMNDAYDSLCLEYEKLLGLESSANYNIYNGYFARYKEYTKVFIDEIYETAEKLGSFITQEIATTDINSETIGSYAGYHELLIIRDFKNFFINSCNGKSFENSLYQSVQNNFSKYCISFFDQDTPSLSTEEVQDLKEVLEAVNADRKNVSESLKEFSMYEFYTTYEGSLIAYEKNNKDANIYYNNIESYFNSNGILDKLYTYLLFI